MILSLIARIRDSFDNAVTVYTQGSCVKFAMILKEVYPQGNILYDQDHAIFEINGKCYDINGYAVKTKNHVRIEEYGLLVMYDFMNLKFQQNKNIEHERICSECGNKYYPVDNGAYDICPNCGSAITREISE